MAATERNGTMGRRRLEKDPPSDEGGSEEVPASKKDYDEYAWFAVFILALSYFVVTRGGQSSRGGVLSKLSKPYAVVASSVVATEGHEKEKSEEVLRSIFYIDKSRNDERLLTLSPGHRLETILSSPPDAGDNTPEAACVLDERSKPKPTSMPYLSHLSSATWVHDEELGRGYLLLADAGRSGRIWRWEVGGGPITIGRSLQMERSGCRSGLWVDADGNDSNGTCPENLFGDSSGFQRGEGSCSKPSRRTPSAPPLLGSASLAVELVRDADRASAGRNLAVAEWGERRIVRLEGETGARTPLVTVVPTQGGEWRRVFRPNHLTYTPFGDFLFSDTDDTDESPVGVVYRLREAVHVPIIAAERSRDAHSWTNATGGDRPEDGNIDELFRTTGVIEGMALGSDFATLFVLVTTRTHLSRWSKTVYKLRIGLDEDGDDSGDEAGNDADDVTVFHETTSADCEEKDVENDHSSSVGSKLALDEKGTLYLIACPSSVTLLDTTEGHTVGSLAVNNVRYSDNSSLTAAVVFTSISFGEDGYLYITSLTTLMRVKSRVGGMALPTNLVVPSPLKKKTAA